MSDFLDNRNFSLNSRLDRFRYQFRQVIKKRDALVVVFIEIADNLDGHSSRINKTKVGGSTVAIVGTILGGVGFGLSFVTFGASLVLTIVGGVTAGVGGAVVTGSQIADTVLSKQRRSSADHILEEYKSQVESLLKEYGEINKLLQTYGDIEKDFPSWASFWSKIVINSGMGVKKIGVDLIGRTVLNSIRMASVVEDTASTGGKVATTIFKTMGTTGKVFHVAGAAFGMVLLPLDIYTLVTSSIDVHYANPHQTSKKIRELAATITAECPTEEDIESMMEGTVTSLSQTFLMRNEYFRLGAESSIYHSFWNCYNEIVNKNK